MFDPAESDAADSTRPAHAGDDARDTHGRLRLRAPPPLAALLQGDGTRASRCRALRSVVIDEGRHREALLLALLKAAADRDLDVRIAALDGLYRLAIAAPRLRERVGGVLRQAALAPSRSTAMHAAALCDALEGRRLSHS